MKYEHHMKPQDIAKKLRVSVQDVYKADQRLKVNYAKSMNASEDSTNVGPEYFYKHRVLPHNDKRVKHEVG